MNNTIKVSILTATLILFFSARLHSADENTHNHHTGLFLGMTSGLYEDAESHFTLGAEYEFYLQATKPMMGIGLTAEVVFAEQSEFIVGVPVYFHPEGSLKAYIMPSMLFTKHEVHTAEPAKTMDRILAVDDKTYENVNYFLLRLGAGWDFHINNFSVTPSLALDLVEAKTYLVYGIGFGILF